MEWQRQERRCKRDAKKHVRKHSSTKSNHGIWYGGQSYGWQTCISAAALWQTGPVISVFWNIKKNVHSFRSWIPRFIIRSARPLLLTPLPSHCVREISVPAKWCEMSGKKQQQGCSRYTHWYAAELCVLWSSVYSGCRLARHFQVRRIFTGEKEGKKKKFVLEMDFRFLSRAVCFTVCVWILKVCRRGKENRKQETDGYLTTLSICKEYPENGESPLLVLS